MILHFYLLLFGVSLILLVTGLWTSKAYLVASAYVCLMVLGLTLISGVEIRNGYTVHKDHTPNVDVYTWTYTTYTNKTFGYLFSTLFGIAFVLTLLEYRPGRRDYE